MDQSIGRPARVETRFVGIDLRVPVVEGEAWRGLSEDEIDANMQEIAKVASWAAAIIHAVVIDPTHLPFVTNLVYTTASMISEEYNQEGQ